MDKETANEIADVYENLRYAIDLLSEMFIGVDAMARTISTSQKVAILYREHQKALKEGGEQSPKIALLRQAIDAKIQRLKSEGEPF